MAGEIQIMIPQYGELNRIYSDFIISHAFSFERQKFITDFYKQYNDTKAFEAAILELVLDKQWIDNWALCGVIMIMLSTPVGSMTAMLAQEYQGDYALASKGVAITTILSVATIPIVSALVMNG